ncbi:Aldo-keto reductase str7 [Marasmius sp. AFHP31]|nr:Aldo-keto reductase str7 [Marasmius sp. AFHP31]
MVGSRSRYSLASTCKLSPPRFKLNPDKRNKIFLATKFQMRYDAPSRGNPQYVKEQFQKSLDRLGVDYLDLYYQHRVDPATPIEKTIGAMAELVKASKVKRLELSECTPNGLRRANYDHPILAHQIDYSL